MCVSLHSFVPGASGGLEEGAQAPGTGALWVLGIELVYSVKTTSALKFQVSSQLHFFYIYLCV